jgi:hypothetical protein
MIQSGPRAPKRQAPRGPNKVVASGRTGMTRSSLPRKPPRQTRGPRASNTGLEAGAGARFNAGIKLTCSAEVTR